MLQQLLVNGIIAGDIHVTQPFEAVGRLKNQQI